MAATSGRQPARLVKIGALTESWGPTTVFVGLREGLQERGYGENKDFVIGVRFTEGSSSELPHAARDLVAHGVDIIVASGRGPEAKAVHEALDLDGSRRPWPNGSAAPRGGAQVQAVQVTACRPAGRDAGKRRSGGAGP